MLKERDAALARAERAEAERDAFMTLLGSCPYGIFLNDYRAADKQLRVAGISEDTCQGCSMYRRQRMACRREWAAQETAKREEV